MLEAHFKKTLGDFTLDARLFAGAGQVTALFGPSGAGKSTLASCLAGLIDPDEGHFRFDGTVLFDSKSNTRVPPEQRRIGTVFQDSRLFPHLSVAGNLNYGLSRTPASQRHVKLDQVVDILDIKDLLNRPVKALSGGEKQRVAFGRAVLTSPRLLILDEPLASLDSARKAEILPFIERLRDELSIPMIYVSHSIDEILRLADDVVVLNRGSVVRAGPAVETLNSETIVHGDASNNGIEPGSVIEARVETADSHDGLTILNVEGKDGKIAGGQLYVPQFQCRADDRIRLRIRARDVALATTKPKDLSILNVLAGKIMAISPQGETHCDILVDIGADLWARITRRSTAELSLTVGQAVYVLIKSVAIDRSTSG
jgi:molybdate transport system ATP-binding protein